MYMPDIFFAGSRALQHLDSCQRLTEQRQDLTIEVYNILYAESDSQYSYDIMEHMCKFWFVGTCFAAERMHRMTKAFAHHANGTSREPYVLKRYLLDVLDNCDAMSFEECKLLGAHPTPDFHSIDARLVQSSKKLISRFGIAGVGNLQAVVDEAGPVQIGSAVAFVAGRKLMSSRISYFVCMHMLRSGWRMLKSCMRTWWGA